VAAISGAQLTAPGGRLQVEHTLAAARVPWIEGLRRFGRHKLAVVGAVFIAVLIAAAACAPLITPADYADIRFIGEAYTFPSAQHWMGVDGLGRDFFSRMVYGARVSLFVGLSATVVALAIGLPLGAISGYNGGAADWFVLRLMELCFPIPPLLIAILLMTILGPSLQNVLIAIAATAWIPVCRLVRGQVLSLRERDFITAARLVGTSPSRIVLRHLLPNTLAPVIVAVTLAIPGAIMTEAGLSFLGVGLSAPTPSWGRMIAEGLPQLNYYWHLAVIPAGALALTMLAFSVAGDGLRDALDPVTGGPNM
jgi:peptide/nickel transport system permease protein/oligopeptide transport system permease protein